MYTWRLVGTVWKTPDKKIAMDQCPDTLATVPQWWATKLWGSLVTHAFLGYIFGGFQKCCYPPIIQILIILIGFSIMNPPALGVPPWWKPPFLVRKFHCFVKWSPSLGESMKNPGCVDSIRKRNVLGRSKASMFVVELPFWSCSTRVLQCFVVINKSALCQLYIYIHTHIHTHIIVHEIWV